MQRQMRFHGRGGEGVKLAGRIASRAGFLAGWAAQDSPLYGAERRGAPVVASVRLGDPPLLERGYAAEPDLIVVLDASLLVDRAAAVLDGAGAGTGVLVNSSRPAEVLQAELGVDGVVVSADVSSLVLERLGAHHVSAPMAAWALRALGIAPWAAVAAALGLELAAIGAGGASIEGNLEVARLLFERMPALPARPPAAALVVRAAPPFVIARLPAAEAAPSIDAGATSSLRTTAGWRVSRPRIDLSHCSRCFLCFALCPEGAIRLDAEQFPVVDYDHCKGCLVCVAECPTHTIREEREATA
jgi:pyruvate ferredoxin oxidoreductase gamma subunit